MKFLKRTHTDRWRRVPKYVHCAHIWGTDRGGGELRWGQTLTFHCIPHSTPEITDPEHGITSKKELLLYPLGLSFSVCFVHTEMR